MTNNLNNKNLFTSESVTEGHPDKIADQISDQILEEVLKLDPLAKVACEIFVTTGLVIIGGEITTTCHVDYQKIARTKILEIGYNDSKIGFDGNRCAVMVCLDQQSPDIENLVIKEDGSVGAGDQGIIFGYATDETKTYLPITLYYSHLLALKLTAVRKNKTLDYLRPDGKTQVTFEYDDQWNAKRIHSVVISTQHDEDVTLQKLRSDIITHVINTTIPEKYLDSQTIFYINHVGKFTIGGPMGDTGLTGRKIIVDTYGGAASHGGGAFSGKDPSKVDRSASYMARYLAKNIVAAKLASKCQIQLAYVIGETYPLSINIDTFNTEKVENSKICNFILDNFDLSPTGIIKKLDLYKQSYSKTASYGHFGQDNESFSWEELDSKNIFERLLHE